MKAALRFCGEAANCYDPAWSIGERHRWEAPIVWAPWTIFMMSALRIFFRNRGLTIIKLRSPALTLISAVAAYVLVTMYMAEQWLRTTWKSVHIGHPLNGIVGYSELALYIMYTVVWIMFITPYSMRAVRLVMVFGAQRRGERPARGSRHSAMFKIVFGKKPTSEIRFVYALVALTTFTVLITAPLQVTPQKWVDTDYKIGIIIECIVIYAMIIAVLITAVVKLRHEREELTINSELRIVSVLVVALGTPWAALMIYEILAMRRFLIPPQWFAVLLAMSCSGVSIVMPLAQCISDKNIMTEMISGAHAVTMTMVGVLNDETSLEYFCKYKRIEMNTDNLDFWCAARYYRTACLSHEATIDSLMHIASGICNRYVTAGSTQHVNFPKEASEAVLDFLRDSKDPRKFHNYNRRVVESLFSVLVSHVEMEMSANSLPAFLRSSEYRELKDKTEFREGIKKLRDAGIVTDATSGSSGSDGGSSSSSRGSSVTDQIEIVTITT